MFLINEFLSWVVVLQLTPKLDSEAQNRLNKKISALMKV